MAKKFDFLSPGIDIREIDQSFLPQEREAEGPIIIGRTRKGPANKPVRIRNLDDFVSIFGLPVPGGNGNLGDVWREGNTIGPTYASYAAQSWLASENSPVTVVRLAGEQHSTNDGSATAMAGWQLGTNGVTADASTNSTAYGLFVCDRVDTGENTTILLEAHASFYPANFETEAVKLRIFRAAAQNPSTAGTGLKFEIVFDNDASTVAAGALQRVENAGGSDNSVPQITAGIQGYTNITQILAIIEDAFDLAIASGDISDVGLDNTGPTLLIHNQKAGSDAGDQLGITDVQNNRDNFKATGVDPADGTTPESATSIRNGTGVAAVGATRAAVNGSLAAVLYCSKGSLALKGLLAHGSEAGGVLTSTAGALVENVGDKLEFELLVFDENDIEVESLNFNFQRNSPKYIRSVLNTNPQLTNTTTIETADQKTYWLGESFVDHLDTNVDLAAATSKALAILMPLGHNDDTAANNWGYHRYAAREAKSGWVFSDRTTNEEKLFRFKSLHVGEDIQRNYLIAIEEITAPTNPSVNAFGSFTVCFKDVAGNTVEKYTGCNLNPASPNYVAKRIGDQYQEWSDTDRRYRTYGDFQNQSNIFYIEMAENVAAGAGQGRIPAGFFGPVRPKGFGFLTGDEEVKSLDLASNFTGSVVRIADDSNLIRGHTGDTGNPANLGQMESAKFVFPQLRMRNNGSDGGASDQARTYWGIRPKISAQSTQHDPDYVDYLRGLGMGQGVEGTHQSPGEDFEYSFIFSLDDVSGSAGNTIDGGTDGVWTWTSGNFGSNNSFTSNSAIDRTFADLLDQNVRQFIMPVWGGSEGFDITEMEPLRNELIATAGSLSETTNYVDYTISKALDSISDEEVVPANLLVMPGIFKAAATNKMINVAESRKDVLAIIDIKGDYRPRAEIKGTSVARLGSVTDALTDIKARNLNSSYACAFYPAVQVSDNLNGGQLVWLPSSVAGLGALGKSQARSELWFAPAGFNRGGLGSLGGPRGPRVLQARQRLDSKERDLLYERNINPIATFPAEGVVIFGQKTLQADASALDRINVRRLLLYLKSEVSKISRNLLFDQNLQSTWNRFTSQVNPVLASTKARFGLSDYRVVLDDTTTTADLVDRNIMYAKIYVKPARAIEYIVVDFVITRTGADFV